MEIKMQYKKKTSTPLLNLRLIYHHQSIRGQTLTDHESESYIGRYLFFVNFT